MKEEFVVVAMRKSGNVAREFSTAPRHSKAKLLNSMYRSTFVAEENEATYTDSHSSRSFFLHQARALLCGVLLLPALASSLVRK